MNLKIIIEKVPDEEIGPGYYYAHIPSLGLTTHGFGIEGAKAAAIDLAVIWIEEKKFNNEELRT